MKLFESGNSYAQVNSTQVPKNFTTTGSIVLIEWYSGSVLANTGLFADITVIDTSSFGNETLGEDGYCSALNPCNHNEGDCDFDNHCDGSNSICIDNGCPSELGFPTGTDCCFDEIKYCSQILSGGNGTWTLQAPVNNPNEKVGNLTCKWFIDSLTNRHVTVTETGSETCGNAVSDPACCTITNPCTLGDGDCDSDSHCNSGFTCGTDNCGPFFPSGFDCCELSDEVVVSNTVINIGLHTYEASVQFYKLVLQRFFFLIIYSFRQHQAL